MYIFHRITNFAIVFLIAGVLFCSAQRRDFLTDAEAELVREHQEVDMRIDILTKFIDRRFAAAGIAGHTWVPPKKNSEAWGEEPKGSRLELLSDIRRLLQKAIDDIDDIASREKSSIEGNEKSGKLFPKAVRDLAKSATRYKPIFEREIKNVTSEAEKGILLSSIEFCDQITEAAATLPEEVKSEKKSKRGN